MQVRFCGVRGSTPSPGPEYVRYGGNTSCVAVFHDDELHPRLILDAGTGLQRLSAYLGDAPFCGTLLLGHLHWDHTHGLPFFRSGTCDGAIARLFLPSQGVEPEPLLARFMSPPHFPIPPAMLGSGWSFHALEEGEYEFEGFRVLAREIPHKGGRMFGYRIADEHSSLAYMSDHHPVGHGPGDDGLGELHENALALADGVDLLVHDAQHTVEEYDRLSYLGHATPDYAVRLGRTAGAKNIALFHHDPWRTDDQVDAIVAKFEDDHVFGAAEETTILLG